MLPVELKPDWPTAGASIARRIKNFQSAGGVPLEPVLYNFKTSGSDADELQRPTEGGSQKANIKREHLPACSARGGLRIEAV